MKWKAESNKKEGTIRVRRKFAWLPVHFYIDTELYYVWLETYEITEEYKNIPTNYGDGYYRRNLQWKIIKQEPLYWEHEV
jgi:hypothetical protein